MQWRVSGSFFADGHKEFLFDDEFLLHADTVMTRFRCSGLVMRFLFADTVIRRFFVVTDEKGLFCGRS